MDSIHISLDVNLPGKNGHEVPAYIKTYPNLKQIPDERLTTPAAEKDIIAANKNHANCYITKLLEVDEFLHAITKIENFWIHLVKLPSKS